MSCAVGEVVRRVRIEVVRNFMSSRISATGRLRSRVGHISMKRMLDGSKGLSSDAGYDVRRRASRVSLWRKRSCSKEQQIW